MFTTGRKPVFDGGASLNEGDILIFPTLEEMKDRIGARTFNGNDYALIIGAPGNVRITYKGEAYPLTVDGRVAKFKLPKP